MTCSSTVEPSAHNATDVGSNPAGSTILELARPPEPTGGGMRAHKIMTSEEYRDLNLKGWHMVCKDYDGPAGGVGIRYMGDEQGRPTDIERLEATVTAWREVFNSIEAHLQDRINMRDPASPETYLAIIRGEVERINRSSDAIVNARWADRARDTAEIERLRGLSPPEPTEDAVMDLICSCWGDRNVRGVLTRTVWKDGIDIQLPSHSVMQFVAAVRALSLQDGAK